MTHKVVAHLSGFRVYESREALNETEANKVAKFVQACWPLASVSVSTLDPTPQPQPVAVNKKRRS